jgi:hypothetical protein
LKSLTFSFLVGLWISAVNASVNNIPSSCMLMGPIHLWNRVGKGFFLPFF